MSQSSDPNPELEIDLPPPALDPSSEAALRTAFHTLSIARAMNFHQAMAHPIWQICVRNKALAISRRWTASAQQPLTTKGIK